MKLRRRSAATLLGLCALAGAPFAPVARAAPPDRPTEPVPDPGKAIASDDDSSAIAVNPANLAFMPGAELRWTWLSTGAASPLPARGHSLGIGFPLWLLATGLRADFLDPPAAAPAPFDAASHWIRWGLALRSNDTFAFGTTLGWGFSSAPALDKLVSVTSGITVRPSTFLSVSAVARDWNRPESRLGKRVERSYDVGLAVRPVSGRRGVELGLEASYFEDSAVWVPRATLGVDVPYLGTLRAGVTLRELDTGHPKVAATAGLDINVDEQQLSAGGVFGNAFTRSGSGFYAGAALRAFREPGLRLPARVVKLRIDGTPGVRGHTWLLRRLWRMATDPEVAGVALVIRAEPASSSAHAEELGDAIRNLRAHGKKVLCHLEDAGGRTLHVCSQADAIAMNPAGGLRFSGLATRYYYLGGLLKKLGVQADFVRIGAHKLAAEQFTLPESSAVGHDDHRDYLEQLNGTFLRDVGGGRRIPIDELARRIARGPFLAKEARESGLVDMLAYDDELGRVVDEVMGRPSRIVDEKPNDRVSEWWGNEPKVAIVYLDGDMVDGESQTVPLVGVRLAGSYTIARALKRAREDRTVRAVVFRVETGGGSSLAADVILREAILTARAKPLIVSMGSQAASGGYYASMSGGKVFASQSTLTGSIGIFYGKVDLSGLLEKLGVHMDMYRTSPRADAESLYRPYTDEEREILGVKVKQFYDLFIARVAEGRHLRPEEVDAVARGRVWTGAQALERRLVDRIGGLREALAEARRLGHLPDDAPIVSMPEEQESLLGVLLNLAGISSAEAQRAVAASSIPAPLLDVARALTPFMVFDASRPLAHVEVVDDGVYDAPVTPEGGLVPWLRGGPGERREEP